MSKNTVCKGGCKCRKCKDRDRRRAIAAGTHIPFVPKGRKAERERALKRQKKLLVKAWKIWKRTVFLRKKVLNAVRRKKKNWLFKQNRARHDENFAKLVCVCVRKKKQGTWRYTEKDK